MPTMIQINDADLKFLDRLADMTADRHCLPTKFYSRPSPTMPQARVLEADILDYQRTAYPSDKPEQAVAFSFEYIEQGDIICTTIIGGMTRDDGMALIGHIKDTGEPLTPGDLIYATGLDWWLERRLIVFGLLGMSMGVIAMILVRGLVDYTF